MRNLFGKWIQCLTCGETWDRTNDWAADVAYFGTDDGHCVACCEFEDAT